MKYDLPQNPGRSLRAGIQAQPDGTLIGLVRNDSPVSLGGSSFRLLRMEGDRRADKTSAFLLPNPLKPGAVAKVSMATVQIQNEAQLRALRPVVESAKVAGP